MTRFNQFLARAVQDGTLLLPGFEANEVAEAKLVPFDPRQSCFEDLLVEAYSRNPSRPTFDNLVEWLLKKGFDGPIRRNVGEIMQKMNGPGKADLSRLCNMLCGAWYLPKRPKRRRQRVAARGSGLAIGCPAVLLCGVWCNHFNFTLFARGKVPK